MGEARDPVVAARVCASCGEPVEPAERFCHRCGAVLANPPAAAAPPPVAPPPVAPVYVLPGATADRRISRSKIGLVLLIATALLSWIPGINLIGGLLGLVGAVLLILGRDAFGRPHGTYVVAALILVLLAAIASVVATGVLQASVQADSQLGPDAAPAAIFADYQNFEFAAVVIAFVSGLGYVFYALALEDRQGRIALGTALALLVFVHVALFVLLMSQLGPTLTTAFSPISPDTGPYNALLDRYNLDALLLVVPDALFAGAYYLAWSRIKRGEIPAAPRLIPMGAPPVAPP